MSFPFKNFKKRDWIIWICSLVLVAGANIVSPQFNVLILIAALLGVTSLIFAAKGNVWSQILMVVFSILYGIISFQYRYWGEMITYLGMTMPMAIWSAVVWFKNPSKQKGVVEIGVMNRKRWLLLLALTIVVTTGFFFVLALLKTPNIVFSTLSITTSFLAAALTILRSPYFALFYAGNDVVLIVLWILATRENAMYFPVIINFAIFLVNDVYGFISWHKRKSDEGKSF